ncbi:chitinase [Kribbella antibiotica]|uniref:Chitinase n=2 Tax=Kribbella antibiotica TaxID=190195 RepID=A0A4R4ZSZ6_9ACTN|nr:chitinase [Kribbella antibiotica]
MALAALLIPGTFVASTAEAKTTAAVACTFTDWVQGQWYTTGSIVKFQGAYYIAEHDNPGYSPTESTWYWDPTSCGDTPPPANCNYPDWVQGQFYATGAIVKFQGAYYIAEHDNPGYSPTESTWYWDPYNCGGTNPPGPGGFPVSEAVFNQMFPSRNSFYTYAGLINALSAYPGFANTGDDTTKKREAAAFLANVNHETGGLVYIKEINEAAYPNYCHPELPYGCPAGQSAYYGRGPLQLSHNFNYKAAGDALGLPLLTNPWLVEQDPAISWKASLWFWNTQTGAGTMTAHNAMVNNQGFGQTIRTINGSIECNGGNPTQVQARVTAYQNFTSRLGVSPGDNLYC